MTPQEQQLLTSLTQKINQTQLQEKDPDAENLLGHELGANPDALYILAQTVLVQDIALDQAKAQVVQLQQQLQQAQQARQQPAHTTSFLGRLLGDKDPQPAPPPPQQPVYQQQPAYQPIPPQQSGYQPVPQYAQPAPPQYPPQAVYQQPQYVPVATGQPSFLRGAMQTAAGVAAGALAFEGVESILHGFGHEGYGVGGMGMGPGGLGMGGGFERPVEETVINNYYDEPGTRGFEHDRPEGEHHFQDTGDQAKFSDADYKSSGDDNSRDSQMGFDDMSSSDDSSNNDDSGSDDTSGFDDGGQDDGGGGFDDSGDSGNDML